MKKKILLFLAITASIFIIFMAGFNLGKRSIPPQITYRIDPEKSTLVEKRILYFTGQVSEIDLVNNAITLFNSGESVKIDIEKDAPVESYAFRQDDKTPNEQPKIVALKDILVRDKVSVYAEAQKNGKPLGTKVYIHFVPVRAF